MKIYKVFYKLANGNESFTFIEADSEDMIKRVLHSVQGMSAELIKYESTEEKSR